MTTVNNVTSDLTTSYTTSTTTSSDAYDVSADDFMTMLVAELQNQDPLNPMDGSDFAAQLAQFSSVAQLSELNTNMSALPEYLQTLGDAQMVSMIGNEATASGDAITVSGSETNISFSLPSDIASGTLTIYNESGSEVGSADLGSLSAGTNSITWDTSSVAAGSYTFAITATDASGNAVTAETLTTGTITGVSYENDTTYLTINGLDVEFSNIVAITKSTN